MKISASTPVAGVVGWPISHSKSPLLHNHWLRTHNLNGVYAAFAVQPDELEIAVRGAQALNLRGLNLTVPHKELVLPYCDELTDAAEAIGAVNTLTFNEGRLLGDNTDGYGFLTHLQQAATNWKSSKPAVVLGAGGAARAAIHALLGAGVPEIRLVNRTLSRAQQLAEAFGPLVRPMEWSTLGKALTDVGLVANTTVLGMEGQPELDVDLTTTPQDCVVYDIVYAPRNTKLLQQAKVLERPVVEGLGMLIHQAVPAFAQWFGVTPKADKAVFEMMSHP